MFRRIIASILALVLLTGVAHARRICPLLCGGNGIPSWVLPGAKVDLDFTNGRYFGGTTANLLSVTRASSATDLLPSSPSGYVYNTYGNNVLVISPGVGLLVMESRTNQLFNSAVPATQTTGSLGTGTYTLWVNGSGSAQMSLGTGVGCGTGTATNGTPVNFTITVAGTCIVTVVGSLSFFQLELGAFGTSGIITAGATATRAADNITTAGALQTVAVGAAATQYVKTVAVLGGSNARLGISYATTASLALTPNGTTQVRIASNSTGTSSTIAAAASVTNTVVMTVSSYSAAPQMTIVANGGVEATSANAVGQAGTASIGSNSGSSNFTDGVISRLAVWNSQLSATTRLSLSTM